MLKKAILLLSLTLSINNTFAQLDNKILNNDLELNPKDSHNLFFSFNSLNFIRNTEYFGPIDRGKTLFGHLANPRLTYFASPYVRIDAGVFYRKDYGNNTRSVVIPTYSIKLSKNGYSGIFGNYEGATMHQFIEPLFNIDYAVSKPILSFDYKILQSLENGIQFKIDKKRVWSDTWIDWQRMIYQNSPFKEEISAGTTNFFTLLGAEKQFKVILPAQATVHHFGGQIDTTRHTHLSSIANCAIGLRLSYTFNEGSFFKELRSDNYYVTYKDISPTILTPYKKGSGIYLNLLLRTKLLNIMASYWDAEKYIAPNGTAIFQSVNLIDPNYVTARVPHRQLFFLRLFYEKQLYKGLNLDIRFEPLYDFNRSMVDFSYSIYLSYKLNAKLVNVKPHFFQ